MAGNPSLKSIPRQINLMFRALKIFLIVLTIIFFSVGIYAKLINTDFEYFSAVDRLLVPIIFIVFTKELFPKVIAYSNYPFVM